MINWKASKLEINLIRQIVDRAVKEGLCDDRLGLDMDITACHLNGCALDLEKLLAAPRPDFGHDLGGISRHLNRDTGTLGGCFCPRTAMPMAFTA